VEVGYPKANFIQIRIKSLFIKGCHIALSTSIEDSWGYYFEILVSRKAASLINFEV
jgi:hypothetical protein